MSECKTCSRKLGRANKSGYCRNCLIAKVNSSPELQARRKAAIRARSQDPAERRRMAELMRRNSAKARQRPEHMEMLREHGRKQYREHLSTPETIAKINAVREETAEKIREARLGWCPPEKRESYRFLVRSKCYPAAEARAIIEAEIAAEKKRQLAKLSPFERQQRALERGATLSPSLERPSLDSPANYGEARWG